MQVGRLRKGLSELAIDEDVDYVQREGAPSAIVPRRVV
jgi:hypothetical protein